MTRRINWKTLCEKIASAKTSGVNLHHVDAYAGSTPSMCDAAIDGVYDESELLALFDAIASSIETDEPQKTCETCKYEYLSSAPCNGCCRAIRVDAWEPKE